MQLGRCSPPEGQGQNPGGSPGGKPSKAPTNPAFYSAKKSPKIALSLSIFPLYCVKPGLHIVVSRLSWSSLNLKFRQKL